MCSPRACRLSGRGKLFSRTWLAFLFAAGLAGAVIGAEAPTTTPAPVLHFTEPVFNFGKQESGQPIKHSFVFTNAGSRALEILDVRPTCGCTVAGAWDRKVEPGHSGSIPVVYNPGQYDTDVHKTVIVISSDPAVSNVVLHLRGTIWRPIQLTPAAAVFGSSSDALTKETRSVRIVSNLSEFLTLSNPVCANPAFQASLKAIKPGKEFELQVTLAHPPASGVLMAPITLKTSSTKVPVVSVPAFASTRLAVKVVPPRIVLPSGPFAAPVHQQVQIEDTGMHLLQLSEPSVDAPGVKATVRELEPGRFFVLDLEFPAGFQVAPGQRLEATVKTSHPQFPTLKVPITQGQSLAEMLSEQADHSPAAATSASKQGPGARLGQKAPARSDTE